MHSLLSTASMLRAANVLWEARAFDVDDRHLPAGRMQFLCTTAAAEIDEALAAEGMQPGGWTGPIHPFETVPGGEPIHTARAIVDHTREVVLRANGEVVAAMSEAGDVARSHLDAANAALDEVLAEF